MNLQDPLLKIDDLRTYFYTRMGVMKAVDGVSFSLNEGEVVGIVGESGSGKTVTGLSIMRLIPPPGEIVSGEIIFENRNLLEQPMHKMRDIRGKNISMIFQEPMTSLNPVFTIGNQICEAIILHQSLSGKDALKKCIDLLRLVGIPSPDKRVREYPFQMSGGMRQRAMIAMALSCNPKILIADEPTTALDVTIQAQILNLMDKLKEEIEAAIILITHNLGVIAEMAQKVIVMYAGRVVESAPVDDIFYHPQHPYTKGLLKTLPMLDQDMGIGRKLPEIPGIVPSLNNLPPGCSFHPRCPWTIEICRQEEPTLKKISDQHLCSCQLL